MRAVILEDDRQSAQLIKEILERDKDFRVVEVLYRADDEALEKARLAKADLYLFDIQIDTTPYTDGIEFATKLKSLFEPQGNAILVYLTGHHEESFHDKAYQAAIEVKPKKFVRKGSLEQSLSELKREILAERPPAIDYSPTKKILLRDILFVQTSKEVKGRIEIVTKQGKTYLYEGFLKDFEYNPDASESKISPVVCAALLKINKGILVNRNWLEVRKKDFTHFEAVFERLNLAIELPIAVKIGPQLYKRYGIR